jgi:hypothetical protein
VPSAMILFGFDLIKPREGESFVLDELVDTPWFHALAPTTVAMRSVAVHDDEPLELRRVQGALHPGTPIFGAASTDN